MDVYALKNLKIENSASGGAFPTLVSVIKKMYIDKKVVVYGAIFNTLLDVVHVRAENEKEEIKFRGSKYVQSDMNGVVKRIEEDLRRDYIVVFSGTPCQNYAVKNYIDKKEIDRGNLILIEIICHGVTNPRVWNDFKKWLERKYKSKLIDFSFRYQHAKWKVYPVKATFENKKEYINAYKIRQYIKLFFSHQILQKKCYTCRFANLDREADITIGDFWGIEEVMPDFKYKDSVSEVLVNTKKGREIINYLLVDMKSNDVIIEECKSKNFIKYQHNLQKPTEKPKDNEKFWEDYNTNDFQYILSKYVGYGLKGKIRHVISRYCAELGIRRLIKQVFNR